MKKLITSGALLGLALAGCSDDGNITGANVDPAVDFSVHGGGGIKRYAVTIENLTSGQPFSPGVVATHTKKASVFEVGEPASEGIRLIAEDGMPMTAVGELTGAPGVFDVLPTTRPVGCIGCPPGPFPEPLPTTLTVEVEARANFKRLSLAVMLICTNDAFTGLDGVKLPGGFKPATHYAVAYDAGTEANDQLFASIVDPCGGIGPVGAAPDGNARPATAGVITAHPGIAGGVGDLGAEHAWVEPVAKITIQRLRKPKK